MTTPLHRFPVGTTYKPLGRHTKGCTGVDVHVTRNLAGELVRVRYVSTHEFMGQVVRAVDVSDSTIARGLISTP